MAVPPGLAPLSLGSPSASGVLETFCDVLCPFSAKLVLSMERHLMPMVFGEGAPYEGRLRIVVRPYPQPWHASSTFVNEAAIAAAKISRTEPELRQDPKTSECLRSGAPQCLKLRR